MSRCHFFAAVILMFCLALVGTAGSDTAKKLVGTWEIVTSQSGAPPGATVEFTKDGKMSLRAKVQNMDIKVDGTYEVKDMSVISKLTGPDGQPHTETHTITKLTDKELSVKDQAGKVDDYKRAK